MNTKQDIGKLVFRFKNKIIKDEVLLKVKNRYKNKNPLKAVEIHSSFPDKLVFINHELTTTNQKLFWVSKLLAKEYSHKYAWFTSEGVFMMKSDGDKLFKVVSQLHGYQ
ncbi:unnamed protein product [Macrosiphum euphorbiae]|uniref:FP protein C-terminal domain-containing protein n=1 Tax=Macrosiphum euphorbiae TaxID=13131 RepID=A0AAV0WDJ0_9HEMI|nr:unnamed protein product [Macrosiphum euphorbiae]